MTFGEKFLSRRKREMFALRCQLWTPLTEANFHEANFKYSNAKKRRKSSIQRLNFKFIPLISFSDVACKYLMFETVFFWLAPKTFSYMTTRVELGRRKRRKRATRMQNNIPTIVKYWIGKIIKRFCFSPLKTSIAINKSFMNLRPREWEGGAACGKLQLWLTSWLCKNTNCVECSLFLLHYASMKAFPYFSSRQLQTFFPPQRPMKRVFARESFSVRHEPMQK